MKSKVTILGLLICVGLFAMREPEQTAYSAQTLSSFKLDARSFALSAGTLRDAVSKIDRKDKNSVTAAKDALIACRLQFKRIEYFMEYFFQYPVNLYNRAPVYEVEEPFMEYQSPVGLQVIEGLLCDTGVYTGRKEILDQCDVIYASAKDIPSILYQFHINDGQVLEANRLELVRIMTLGITGYDAPVLKTGISESEAALTAMKDNLSSLLALKGGRYADSITRYLDKAISLLRDHPGFDDFDRLEFLTAAMLPLQEHFSAFVQEHNLDLNTHTTLNHDAANLFRKDAIAINTIAGNKEKATIGRILFSEKALSGNGTRSCAGCHQPDKYFTDGLVKSKTLDGKAEVMRNAPSLLYAALQHTQFHDGRAGNLEEQIKMVLQNPLEMNASLETITATLNADEQYRTLFKKAYPESDAITIEQVTATLAAYEQTLLLFNSPFDKYIAGERNALTAAQKKGFNLFMGKAQCGTCHFAPVFNGLLPPYYEVSELEVLGVPQRLQGRRLVADVDSGRYHFFPIEFNNGAFKTTTVRNAAMTAPYMHNGVFKDLGQVMDFYNKGGGKGMGLDVAAQTLSDKPLKLTKEEIHQLTAFIQALTDDISALR